MKIMITGGMGFIGSHLCEQLLIEKHDLVVLTKGLLLVLMAMLDVILSIMLKPLLVAKVGLLLQIIQ